jgi:hypothetical protein
MAMHRLRSMMHRWQVKNGLVDKIPTHWQGKMILATQLGVPTYGLPYSGSDGVILLAKTGAEFDKRIHEELERRRQRAKLWGLV